MSSNKQILSLDSECVFRILEVKSLNLKRGPDADTDVMGKHHYKPLSSFHLSRQPPKYSRIGGHGMPYKDPLVACTQLGCGQPIFIG